MKQKQIFFIASSRPQTVTTAVHPSKAHSSLYYNFLAITFIHLTFIQSRWIFCHFTLTLHFNCAVGNKKETQFVVINSWMSYFTTFFRMKFHWAYLVTMPSVKLPNFESKKWNQTDILKTIGAAHIDFVRYIGAATLVRNRLVRT